MNIAKIFREMGWYLYQQVTISTVGNYNTISRKTENYIYPTDLYLMMGCKVCEAGYIGYLMTQRVKAKEITITEFCDYFGITKKEAYEHLERHKMEKPEETLSETRKHLDNLKFILDNLNTLLTKALANPKTNLQALTGLIREYRSTLQAVAELENKVRESEKILEVEEYNRKLDRLVSVLTEELCPKCKAKLVEVLDEIE